MPSSISYEHFQFDRLDLFWRFIYERQSIWFETIYP